MTWAIELREPAKPVGLAKRHCHDLLDGARRRITFDKSMRWSLRYCHHDSRQ